MVRSLKNALTRLLDETGQLLLDQFGRARPQLKTVGGVTSWVSDADRAAEERLRKGLAEIDGDAAFLGEESAPPADLENLENRSFWCVDPLDGTHAFLAGYPTWGVSVAYVESGMRPVVGAVYLPVSRQLFFGRAGEQSTLDGQPIQATESFDARSATLLAHSSLHRRYHVQFPGKVRGLGCTSAHLCYVASGSALAATVSGYLWDIAAGVTVLAGAGAQLKRLDGSPLDLRELLPANPLPGIAVASHPDVFPLVRDALPSKNGSAPLKKGNAPH